MASRELNILIRAKNLASGAIQGVKRDLAGINRDISRGLGNAARNIERGLVVAGGVAVAGLGLAVKTAIDFETAFAGVAKTVDATATKSMPQLRAELEKLSTVKPQSFEDLAQIAEFGGQLGVTADEIGSFTDTVSDFLVAVPSMGLEEAAFGLERVRLLTGAARDELDETASVVVELGNNFSTTEAAILGTAERFASTAAQANISTAATLGLSAAVTALGGEPQEAGTSLQRLFQNISLAIAEGGDKADLFAEVAGTSAAEFRRAWETDAEGALLSFLEGMGALSDDGIEQIRVLDELGLADTRLGKNVLNLANNLDVTRGALNAANQEWAENDALTTEAAKRYETAAAQFDILKNNLRLAAATIGAEVLPVLTELSQELVAFLQQEDTQARIKEFAQDVGEAIRSVADWLRSLDWESIGRTLETAAGFARGVVDAFLAMPSWVQQAVVTGWGLNKLTGGALGSILGSVATGLIKGVLGINAGVVNVNAATVNGVPGGGVAGAGRAGGLAAGALGTAGGVAMIRGGMLALEDIQSGDPQRVWQGFLAQGIPGLIGRAVGDALQPTFDEFFGTNQPEFPAIIPVEDLEVRASALDLVRESRDLSHHIDGGFDGLHKEQREITAAIAEQKRVIERQKAEAAASDRAMLSSLGSVRDATKNADSSAAARHARAVERQNATIAAIDRKDFSPRINVTSHTNVTANISVSATQVARSIRIQQAATQTSFSGRGGESRF